MGKKSRTSVLKRQRELKKAEKAALKQAQRDMRSEESPSGGGGQQVATQDDLEGYGLGPQPEEEEESA